MSADPAFHFPPDVFDAVVDAVPLLTRAKKDVVLFFRNSGVPSALLVPFEARISSDPTFSKYAITRELLTLLNDAGDKYLGQRRQLLKRIAEFEEFSSCYPDNVLKAKGAVAAVAQLVNKKDSFTRLANERDDEQRRHRAAQADVQRERQQRAHQKEKLKRQLSELFGMRDPHKRGKALEVVMNGLFAYGGILVREAFTLVEPDAGGVVEQVDGAVEINGQLFLVEMKWWSARLGVAEVSQHLVRLWSRAEAGGIFISSSGYTEPAIAAVDTVLSQRVAVLVELEEIVYAVEHDVDLRDLLKTKIVAATLDKKSFVRRPGFTG